MRLMACVDVVLSCLAKLADECDVVTDGVWVLSEFAYPDNEAGLLRCVALRGCSFLCHLPPVQPR